MIEYDGEFDKKTEDPIENFCEHEFVIVMISHDPNDTHRICKNCNLLQFRAEWTGNARWEMENIHGHRLFQKQTGLRIFNRLLREQLGSHPTKKSDQ
jgi:hypothetical protein